MAKSARLRLSDLRAIRDITHECREFGDAPGVWRVHWFQRLARLIGSELVVGGDVAVCRGGSIRNLNAIDWGWENGLNRAGFLRACAEYGSELTTSPVIDAYFRRAAGATGQGLARTDLVPDREWYAMKYFRTIHLGMGVDHALASFLALPGRAGEYIGVTLSRGADVRKDFSPRDRELLREANAWVAPLVGGPLARLAEPSPADLAPRVRQVLRCFLEGDSDKQVAARLGITRHTVNEYAKVIYRHFGVATRGELLARWVRRGWGAACAWAEARADS